MKVWTIAAFSQVATSGNLAGVAVVSEYPSDPVMQEIASKLNYSETAFLKPKTPNSDSNTDSYEIRWFTPKYEVALCGHATLAAAFLLWNERIAKNPQINF